MSEVIVQTQPDPKYKAPVSPVDVFIGLIIGTVFTTLAIVDLSVLTLDNNIFTAQYYIWKSQAAYVKIIVGIFSCTLPLAFLAISTNVIQTFTRKATLRRHIMDWLHAVALGLNVFTAAVHIAPAELRVVSAALKSDVTEVGYIVASSLFPNVVISVVCQVSMLIIPLIKYADTVKNPVPQIALDTPKDGKVVKMKDTKSD